MTRHFREQPFELPFRLGEVKLFVLRYSSLTVAATIADLQDEPRPAVLPFDHFPSGVDVVVCRSERIAESLPAITVSSDAIRYVLGEFNQYYIDLSTNMNGYLSTFSSKSRSTLLRKIKRAGATLGGHVTLREYRKPGEMPEFHRLAREVSARTYQERLLDAGLPDGARFVESMCHLAAEDHVRAYLLFCDERPIAYMYCPVRDGVLLYQYVGYDPEYQHGSPGTVLQYLALEQIFAEGKFLYFDFTEGQGQHKEQLATHAALCANLCYFRRSWRNLLVLRCHQALDRISRVVVRALDRLGLKSRIKKLVRTWRWRS
jgi:CelD/BcsL family acetyltransferase involved in cellulose biosynthesis